MKTTVNNFRCKYGIPRQTADGWAVARRLDGLARKQTVEVLGDSLEQVLCDDPAIYVVRGIKARLRLPYRMLDDLPSLADRWGKHLAAAVMHAIAGQQAGQVNVVTFADQAEFVGRFVEDLLKGRAWDLWFYGAFQKFRHLSVDRALGDVLLEHPDEFPAVLRHLEKNGCLEILLQRLDRGELRRLWVRGLGGAEAVSPAALRPLFETACTIADRLQLRSAASAEGGSPAPSAISVAEFGELFEKYLAAGPAAPDWRDSRGLAGVVLDAIRFLVDRRRINVSQWRLPTQDLLEDVATGDQGQQVSRADESKERRAPSPTGQMTLLAERIRREVAQADEWDWLDAAWLGEQLSRLLLGETPGAESVAAPSQPQAGDESRNAAGNAAAPTVRRTTVRGLTVRQHELFADLVAALKTKSISLPLVATFDPALALKLFAVLIAAAPRWSGDPLAATLIERLLHALAEVGRADDSDRVMSLLREGKPDKALRFAAADRRAQAMAAYRFLATVLDAEPELVQAVETTSGSPPKSAEATVVETRAAGAFLLVRALIDSRFAGWAPTLVDSRRDETLAALLAVVGIRWAGLKSNDRDPLNEGICLFAGPNCPDSFGSIQTLLRGVPTDWHVALQRKLCEVLAGQRLLDSQATHLFWLPEADHQHRLVLGDASGRLWLRGQTFDRGISPTATLLTWLNDLAELTAAGDGPVIADATLADAVPLDVRAQFVSENDQAGDDSVAGRHVAARRRLQQSLAALELGRVGLPDVDLTLDLAALALLRLWARWLRQFADSSATYVLESFVRRGGRVTCDRSGLTVRLDPGPLDVVLEMAGYLDEIPQVPWMDLRRIRFAS